MSPLKANCLPLLIGSLPLTDHAEAAELIFAHTPEIPLWPQLPAYREEGMLLQFIQGLPGVREQDGRVFIDTASPAFEAEVLAFYEEYLMVTEGAAPLETSRFRLPPEAARGFYAFLELADKRSNFLALKGQITGPITFCTSLVDQDGRAIFYNEQLRDAAVKHLALKARWQARKMTEICEPAIVFFDEPGLAGLGSSAFITITKEDILASFAEVFAGVREESGLTGVHVCANTEWPVIFESGVDIVSYDAYSFFEKLVLYKEHLQKFFARGGILATGIVPTAPEFIDIETVDSLVDKWSAQTEQLQAMGISREKIFAQTLITPSCGTGAVSRAQAEKVLQLTREVSARIRASWT